MAVNNNDVIRVTAKMSQAGNDVQNVFYIRNNGAGTVDDSVATTEILSRMDAAYALMQPEQSDTFNYDSIELFNVTQDVPMGEFTWPTLTTGASVSEPLPNQVSGLVLFPTNVARSQGRTYIGGHPEGNNNTAGNPDGDATTAMSNWAAAILSPWLVGTGEFEFGNYNTALLRFASYISAIVRDVWRTQRRRAAGVGT